MWLRKFTYHQIKSYYDKEKEQVEKSNRGSNSTTLVNPDGTINKQEFKNAQPRAPIYK
tara:strand:+ start:3206 stop:3379 length:174 start_codon:yes stop_codon:yes gene_type:complete